MDREFNRGDRQTVLGNVAADRAGSDKVEKHSSKDKGTSALYMDDCRNCFPGDAMCQSEDTMTDVEITSNPCRGIHCHATW